MNQREWKTGNAKVELTAASNIEAVSAYEWVSKYNFKAEYSKETKEGWTAQENGSICYYSNGILIHNEQKIDSKWHYFDPETGQIVY